VFFLLSNLLDFLISPLIWILGLLLLGLFSRKASRKRGFFLTATLLLLFFSNPFFLNEAWLAWETPPTPMEQVPIYDAGIVLTGITNIEKSPHDRVHLHKGADRLLHALQLYREGKIGKFIISGGSGALREAAATEAGELRKILLLAQVPEADILLEDQSRNTRENALNTRTLLSRHPELRRLLLITSAFHMRRATGSFRKAGLEVTPFATDFYSGDRRYSPAHLLLPQERSLYEWQRLLHEITGYLVYAVLGYL
jgi:uncharacterized SAM-binding protein YcdF (DUF218 family)